MRSTTSTRRTPTRWPRRWAASAHRVDVSDPGALRERRPLRARSEARSTCSSPTTRSWRWRLSCRRADDGVHADARGQPARHGVAAASCARPAWPTAATGGSSPSPPSGASDRLAQRDRIRRHQGRHHRPRQERGPRVRARRASPSMRSPRASPTPRSSTSTPTTRAQPRGDGRALRADVPLGRIGRPEDIAATVAFLLSAPAGAFVGQVLGPNGGSTRIQPRRGERVRRCDRHRRGLSGGLPAAATCKGGPRRADVEANSELGRFCRTHETVGRRRSRASMRGRRSPGTLRRIADLDLESYGFASARSPVTRARRIWTAATA